MKALILALVMLYGATVFAQAVTTTTVTVPTTNPRQQVKTVVSTTTNPNVPTEEDGRIVSSIYGIYNQDATMTGTSINASSLNGIVTLSGTVTVPSQSDQATRDAKKVPGVKSVISNIVVKTNPGQNVQPTVKNYN